MNTFLLIFEILEFSDNKELGEILIYKPFKY